jgi:hypothetical protein
MVILIRVLGFGFSARASLFRGKLCLGVFYQLVRGTWHVLHVSGNANNGSNAGTFTFNGNNDSSNRNRNIGTHLAV